MAGTLGGEDAFGASGDIDARQALVQLLAQAGQAQGRAIIEQILHFATADQAHGLGHLGVGTPCAGQPAAAELEQFVMAFTKLSPTAIHRFAPGLLLFQRQAWLAFGDEKPVPWRA